MNTSLDYIFQELVAQSKLQWFPWVGENYLNTDSYHKLLIIGESHYHDGTPYSIEKHKSTDFTREVIVDLGINRNYCKTKLFSNFHRAIFANDKFNSEKFWNLVSFYNFIQITMNTNNGRPAKSDFENAWASFFDLLPVLKPKTCLFIGTSSANYLTEAIVKNSKFKLKSSVSWEEKIGRAHPKSAIVLDPDGNEFNLVFIKHTSKMFSWSSWNSYLIKKIGDKISYLENKI